MKKAIIIIVSVIVILGGVFASLFFFTDVFNFLKPANTNFALQAKKLLGTENGNNYSDYEKFLNNLKSASGTKTANVDISMNMNLPTSVLDKDTQNILNSSKVNLTTSYDADKKTTSAIANLKYNNKYSISAEAIIKDQSISIKSSDIYDKYLTFDLSKYEEFCKKNNIDIDQDTLDSIKAYKNMSGIDSSNLLYDLFYISEKDYKSLDKTYGNLENLIDKKAYTSKKNQKVSVNGSDEKTTAYSLTLTGENGYDFISKLIESMKDDSTLKSLIVSKYDILKKYLNSITEATGESSSDLPDLTESNIEEYLEKLLDSLKDSKNDFEDIEKCIKITIYSKKDNPFRFEIAILDDKKDDEGDIIFTEELSDGKNTYTIDIEKISKIFGASNNSKNYYDNSKDNDTNNSVSSNITNNSKASDIASAYSKIIITDEYEAKDTSRKGTATISVKPSGSSKQDLITIEYDNINSKSEFKTSMSISLSSSAVSLASLSGISGLSDSKLDYTYHVTGLDSDKQDIKFSINGKLASYSVAFDMTGSVSNKSDIPDVSSSNSVDVFSMTLEELQPIYTDVINSAADKLPAKLSNFGLDITKEDILGLLPDNTQTPATQSTTLEMTDTTNPVVTEPAA